MDNIIEREPKRDIEGSSDVIYMIDCEYSVEDLFAQIGHYAHLTRILRATLRALRASNGRLILPANARRNDHDNGENDGDDDDDDEENDDGNHDDDDETTTRLRTATTTKRATTACG